MKREQARSFRNVVLAQDDKDLLDQKTQTKELSRCQGKKGPSLKR